MAKTHCPTPEYGPGTWCVAVWHWWTDAFAHTGPFHSIFLWDAFYANYFDSLYLTAWDGIHYNDHMTTSAAQLGLCRALLANPGLISDTCGYCNGRWEVPHAIRWGGLPPPRYPYDVPCCIWDGSDPLVWSPGTWPPRYLT
jgi:hypothetical protein